MNLRGCNVAIIYNKNIIYIYILYILIYYAIKLTIQEILRKWDRRLISIPI